MSYLITSYCSSYGTDEIFLVNNIEDIYYFIINYVIYPSSIYKNDNFKIEDIPTIENIKEILDNPDNELQNNMFGAKEILVYEETRYNSTYYVTVKKMKDISQLKIYDDSYLNIIKDFKKYNI